MPPRHSPSGKRPPQKNEKQVTTLKRRIMKKLASCLLFLLCCSTLPGPAAEADPSRAPVPKIEETNSADSLRAYLQVQEQLHATQLLLDRNRKESEVASQATAHATEVLAERLHSLEQTLGAQRSHE